MYLYVHSLIFFLVFWNTKREIRSGVMVDIKLTWLWRNNDGRASWGGNVFCTYGRDPVEETETEASRLVLFPVYLILWLVLHDLCAIWYLCLAINGRRVLTEIELWLHNRWSAAFSYGSVREVVLHLDFCQLLSLSINSLVFSRPVSHQPLREARNGRKSLI